VTASAHESCPEPAVLAAYVDGVLRRTRVADVTRHVTRCARCRILIEDLAAIEKERPATVVAFPSRRLRQWAIAAAVLIAAVALPLLWRGGESARPDPIAALAAASPTSARTIAARLSGGFRWAPLLGLKRSEATAKSAEELVASGAAGAVLREIGSDRSPRALHAAGVAYLIAGDTDSAVKVLGDAVRRAPGNARVWSDYAGALYTAAKSDDAAEIPQALAAADRAVHLNPRLAEALFNRALVLDRIGTEQQRGAAWCEYLAQDPDGPWAAEARERLDASHRKE
jgi:tetratricopeptide (TPR) repeat protein